MKLSTKGKYGLYAMDYLAQHDGDGPQPLKAIAEIGVQEDYLEQLLGTLRRAGLVTTVRGAQGGYQLARSADAITVGDVIEAMEGPLSLAECVSDGGLCDKSDQCRARRVWGRLSAQIGEVLHSITLSDMLSGAGLCESFSEEPDKNLLLVHRI